MTITLYIVGSENWVKKKGYDKWQLDFTLLVLSLSKVGGLW